MTSSFFGRTVELLEVVVEEAVSGCSSMFVCFWTGIHLMEGWRSEILSHLSSTYPHIRGKTLHVTQSSRQNFSHVRSVHIGWLKIWLTQQIRHPIGRSIACLVSGVSFRPIFYMQLLSKTNLSIPSICRQPALLDWGKPCLNRERERKKINKFYWKLTGPDLPK